MEVKVKHIAGDAWEVSLPARKSALVGNPAVRPRRTVHAPDEVTARALGTEVLEREYPAYLKGATLDLTELVEYYLDHAAASGIYTRDTAHDYRLVILRYLKPYFAMDADRVAAVDIERLYGFLQADAGSAGLGVSTRTVRKLNTILRAAYDFLVREGIVESSPMHAVHLPKYVASRRRALTDRELGKIVAGLEESIPKETDVCRRNCLFGAYLDLWLGARVAEVCAITRGDISFARGEVTIDEQVSERGGLHLDAPKTSAGKRVIAPGAACMDAIKSHIEWQQSYLTAAQRESERTPLCTDATGKFIRPSTMSAVFKCFAQSQGVELAEGESFHLIRHTSASLMLANGVSVTEAQARLGHKRASTTLDNYGHAMAGEGRSASMAMDEAIEAAKDEEGAW